MFTSLQNFSLIIQSQFAYEGWKYIDHNPSIIHVTRLPQLWRSRKSMWFSHEKIKASDFPMTHAKYTNTPEQNVSLLLQYDQLFRHPCDDINPTHRPIAFRFATYMAFAIIHSGQFDTLHDSDKVFVLLALRHNPSLQMKKLALTKAKRCLDEASETSLWLRFMQATILDIDDAKKRDGVYQSEPTTNEEPFIHHMPHDWCNMHKDHSEMQKKYSDILETRSKTDYSVARSQPIHSLYQQCLVQFQIAMDHYMHYVSKQEKQHQHNNHNETKGCNPHTIGISISGGVDSMVLSYIASQWCKVNNCTMKLIHICYNNRNCCTDEINFLRDWATKLNAPLTIRRIDELTRHRSTKYREMYEEVTRKIRFSFYKWFNCPVLLGHNRDDTYENIFSNLSKQIHFDDLYGMKPHTVESDISIIRPFLSIPKQTLLTIADACGIPHLYDSTPPWSRRGKTRDILIPAINEFDANILPGLHNFVKYTSFLHAQWEHSCDEWMANNVSYDPEEKMLTIHRSPYFEKNAHQVSFWIKIWFHYDIPTRPSNKSFLNLIQTIKDGKTRKSDMNKVYRAHVTQNHVTFIQK